MSRTAVLVALQFLVGPSGPARTADAPGQSASGATVGSSEAWQSTIRRNIEHAEYEVAWQAKTAIEGLPAAWHAPNRAQGFRTHFTDSGIRVVPRSAKTRSWEWRETLVGWGRPGAVAAVEAASLRAKANRIEYDRGRLVEWYVNDTRGLEQGFTLAAPPPGPSDGGIEPSCVWIELAVGGTLLPAVSADGRAIDFSMPSGMSAVHSRRLVATDATGRALSARVEGSGVGIRLVLEDEGAVYPVTVVSLVTTSAWTAESDQASGQLGYSLASAGDVNGDGHADAIVAATFYDSGETDEGRVLVYHGSAAGLATTPSWTVEGDQEGAWLGYSVATAGDVNGDGYSDVIVGAVFHDDGETDEGRALVYPGSAAGLATTPSWTAEGDRAFAEFGYSVATAGDVNGDGYSDVIVGAEGYDDSGRVFVYSGSAAGLATAASWTVGSDQAFAAFGNSVATAGDVNGDGYSDVIIGASVYDNGAWDEGRAFVYHGAAAGLAITPSWTAEGNQQGAWLGYQVATAGDVNGDGYADVIVGAFLYDHGETDEGQAFVYLGSPAGLAATASWTAEGNQAFANLGSSVATAGDVNGDGYADVIVGAIHYDNGEEDEGGAFVYLGSPAGLAASASFTAESDQTSAELGYSVATAGDVNGDGYADVIVGAWGYDNGETDEGRALVYHGSPAGLATAASWTAESDQEGGQLGYSLAPAGDVNGDGYADVIVAAAFFDTGVADEGRAFVYHGSAAGLLTTASWTMDGDQESGWFGYSVARAGDVNGDGFSDVIIGAVFHDNGETNEGRAFVYHGSAAGLETKASWTAEGDRAFGEFGYSVATAGDVNGDGYADVIVGGGGRVFVYHGSPAGLATAGSWKAEGFRADEQFGYSVATAGDVNGDGYADVIVGAPFADNGSWDEGRAFVYLGSAAGLTATASWTAEGNQQGAWFGYSVGTAGDVNGDGHADVIVGAFLYDNGETDEGRAFVYHGSAAGLAKDAAWTAESDQPFTEFGSSVATAGDVNGDGYADVIVGAIHYDNGEEDEGGAFVYHGSAAGLATTASWTAESDQPSAELGYSVGTAGDVNGDGYADVIVGAWGYDSGEADEGRSFVFYGNGGRGLSLRPQQRRANDTGAIAHLGVSDSGDSFRLALLGRSPFGRGQVQLEWEVKPVGAPLNGVATQIASHWADSGVEGAALSEPVVDLLDLTPYHWRVRIRYNPATTPFAQQSRWLTAPWGGWQEAMLRTADPAFSPQRVGACD